MSDSIFGDDDSEGVFDDAESVFEDDLESHDNPPLTREQETRQYGGAKPPPPPTPKPAPRPSPRPSPRPQGAPVDELLVAFNHKQQMLVARARGKKQVEPWRLPTQGEVLAFRANQDKAKTLRGGLAAAPAEVIVSKPDRTALYATIVAVLVAGATYYYTVMRKAEDMDDASEDV